jgi:S1-C subfamily serine protease/RNA polymerase subunit RPABC4/transcription elongation factor Spt4
MNDTKVCSHCAASFSEEAHFCPTCGYPTSCESANWFDRLCAAVVDVSMLVASCGLLMWLGLKWWVIFLTWLVSIEIGYQLKGSIGKSFVGISVPVKTRFQHYLRETVGKLASLAIFGIGFLMIFSKERLALHDYMAKTRVLRIAPAALLRQAIISLSLLFSLVAGAYLLLRTDSSNHFYPLLKSPEPSSLSLIVKQMPAVATLYVYNGRGKLIGQGSGFLITSDGVGVTNFHVIKDAYSADVKLGDGRLYHLLSVHAYEAGRDIAIFQLGRKTSVGVEEAKDLPYLSLATQEARIGDRIATIGSPEGLSNSVSDGLVSAVRGEGEKYLLQITAPISPGSSGGPVFNLKGEVVAITSFQFTEGQNLNFAIPISEVSALKDQRAGLPLERLYEIYHLTDDRQPVLKEEPSDLQRKPGKAVESGLLVGSFVGTVHNLSANMTSHILIFVEEYQGTIQGCLGVRAPLYGSGPLQGIVNGNDVQFDVTSPSFYLHFDGRRSGSDLSGTYTALPQGGREQHGEFVLQKQDSKRYFKKFDPQTDCPTDADMNR